MPGETSYALDDVGALAVQLIGIAGMRLLLAVLQAGTGVGFQHAVLGAVVAIAEAAVADNALSGFLALLEVAARLAGRHDGIKGGENGAESRGVTGVGTADKRLRMRRANWRWLGEVAGCQPWV